MKLFVVLALIATANAHKWSSGGSSGGSQDGQAGGQKILVRFDPNSLGGGGSQAVAPPP